MNQETISEVTLELRYKAKLKKGDVFLWKSAATGKFAIHTFHSDVGYGVKTYTNFNEKDGSSTLVNYSGICGVLSYKDEPPLTPAEHIVCKDDIDLLNKAQCELRAMYNRFGYQDSNILQAIDARLEELLSIDEHLS